MQVALRERNLDAVVVQGIVDEFLGTRRIGVVLLHRDALEDGQVHAVVAEVVETHLDAEVRIHDVAPVDILDQERLQRVLDDFPDGVHIDPVLDAHGDGDQLVGVVLREVLEVLVEQGRVREGHDGTVGGDDLGALVGDGIHPAADAFALDEIAHPEAAGHQLDAAEEVVQDILHCKTETGRETGADHLDGPRRDLQEDEHRDDVDSPQGNADDVLRQGEVRLIFMEDALLGALQDGTDLDQAVEGLEGIGQIAEHEEQRDNEDELGEGEVDVAFDVQEGAVEVFFVHAAQVEHAGSQGEAERDGEDDEDGKQRLLRQ